jgi:hypothetical protein
MKRTYDFNRISIDTGFNPVQIERVLRISDILENISTVPAHNYQKYNKVYCCKI